MSAPCWRGCGRPALPESLACEECREQAEIAHNQAYGRFMAEYARDVNRANATYRATTRQPCAKCGKPDSVTKRWVREQGLERERKSIQRQLERGIPIDSEAVRPLDGAAAYTTSFGLASPAGNFDPEDWCSDCKSTKYDNTFYGD